ALEHVVSHIYLFFFFTATATTPIYTLSLTTLFRSLVVVALLSDIRGCPELHVQRHGIAILTRKCGYLARKTFYWSSLAFFSAKRSEEHTSELQSRFDLVCRLLLEKKKHNNKVLPNV